MSRSFKRCILLLPFLSLVLLPIQAQTNRKHRIYEAYISGNRAQWVQVVGEMEHSTEPKTLQWKLELSEYYYGLAGYYIGIKNNTLAAPIISKGNALIDGALKDYSGNATFMALKGTFTAFKINLNRYKVLILGRESLKWMDKALAADPENVQALADMGNALMHAPALFGGDPEEGLRMLRKGISLLEKRNQVSGNWFYLQLLITTGKAYQKTGRPEKARYYYEKALQVEPRFRLVKEVLLPELDKKS